MNDSPVYTEAQAALIDVHSHACALAQRYGHACDVLLEDGDLKSRFQARRDELDNLGDELESRIRDQNLLPHDINVDKEDLARLADRFREWFDHERHQHLQNALAHRESELLDALETLQQTDGSDDAVENALAAGRRMLDQLNPD